jgi:hypothetical protein
MSISGVEPGSRPAPNGQNGGNGNGNGNGELTGLQRAFLDKWFDCRFNGTEAARQAGVKGGDKACQVYASRTLSLTKVKAEIERRFSVHGVTGEEVINVLAAQMRGNVGDFLTEHGGIDIDKVRSPAGQLVAEYREYVGGGRSIKLHSQQKAAELIGKHLGLFSDRDEMAGLLNIILDRPADLES